MRARHDSISITTLASLCAAGILLGCDPGTSPPSSAAMLAAGNVTAMGDAGTTATLADGGTAATRPLLCAPSVAQTGACANLAAGAACTYALSVTNGNADADGNFTINGTCRPTVDGTGLGCAQVPPPPPTERTQPCVGKAAGDACNVERLANGPIPGVCLDARGSGTLVCGRVRTPPQPRIDACAGMSAGATCAFATQGGGATVSGVCGKGPTGAGPLACGRSHDPTAHLAAACTGLSAGAACALGRGRVPIAGSCTTPAGGGAPLCLATCPDRPFHVAVPEPGGQSSHPDEPVPPYVPGTTGN